MICEHNEKLASHDQKKIKKFVTLIFFIFCRGFFRRFFCSPNISKMATSGDKLQTSDYMCSDCDYICYKKSEWTRHISTAKHINATKCYINATDNKNICHNCNKTFLHHSSYYRHKKKCSILQTIEKIASVSPNPPQHSSSEDTQMNLILELVKQNQEFKDLILQQSNQMMEQNKTIIEVAKNSNVSNTISNSNNNSNNKTFNLNFFLNETCKDAMNMKDFIKSLELSMPELEKMGELGFAEGMSRVFINRLNSLDVTKRPIHCSDVKREIIHIKDDNKWERDNANLDRLRKIIKQITHKNILRVDDWKKANPGCTEYNSKKYDHYLKLTMETIGPIDDAGEKRDFGKIIRRVAENTAIDKKYLCM